jgi:hypothetical protein
MSIFVDMKGKKNYNNLRFRNDIKVLAVFVNWIVEENA